MTKYKEIFKLKRMLEKDGIPFEFVEGFGYDEKMRATYPDLLEHYQICYPEQGDGRWISVIEGFGTYGGQYDRLEIMGGLTPWEEYTYESSILGYLTAQNVYNRIKKDWEERNKK